MPRTLFQANKPAWPYVLNKDSDLAQGLVGWWPGDPSGGTKLYDLSGRNNHGALTALTPFSATQGWAPALSGGKSAIRNGGTNSYVVTASEVFDPSTTNLTASCWFYITTGSVTQDLIAQANGTGTGRAWIFLNGTNNLSSTLNNGATISGSPAAVVGQWNHAAVTLSGNLTLNLYLNGTINGTGTNSGANSAPGALLFGINKTLTSQQFNGLMSDFTIWNRALTASEVYSLFDPQPRWQLRYKVGRRTWFLGRSGISFDAASNSGYQAATSSLSWSHTWTGSNRFLAIDVSMLSVTDTVTAMTYGGANCTLVGAQNVVCGTGRGENWRICQNASGAPATGANTISVTLSGSLACAGTATSYTSVNQSVPTEAWNGNSGINAGTGTNATVVVTTIANNDWVHAGLATNQSSGIASSQTSRNIVAGTLGTGANADTGPITPAAAQTMTWSREGITSAWAVGGYAIRPTSAPSPTSGFPIFFPVGQEVASEMWRWDGRF